MKPLGIAGLVLAFAWPALAQDPTSVSAAGYNAYAVLAQQGILGLFSALFLYGVIRKDNQLTAERAIWMEKLVTLAISNAADNAKTTAAVNINTQVLERVARKLDKDGT